MLSHQFVFRVSPRATCFRRQLEHSSVESLGIIRFLILKRITNCFQQLFPLLSFHRYSPNLKRFAHRVTRHQARPRVRHRRAFLHSRLLASSSHGAPLSNLIVKMSLKWVQKKILNKRRCFHSRFLWSECPNNQSRATVWVIDLCLIVGLRRKRLFH